MKMVSFKGIHKSLKIGRQVSLFPAIISVFLLFGCAHKEKVRVPPRVGLQDYRTIGIIQFSSNSKDDLEPYVTQNFMQSVQSAQPNVRFLELGHAGQLLRRVNSGRVDPETAKLIGRKYYVDAIFTGRIEISEVKPTIKLSSKMTSVKAKASIEAVLSTRLMETGSGATRWTRSSTGKESVANISLSDRGHIHVGISDPEEKYGSLLRSLVKANTQDFRPYYVFRKVSK